MYTYYVNTSPHSSLFLYLCVYVFVTDIHLCVYRYPQYIELFAQFFLFTQCNQSSNHNGHFCFSLSQPVSLIDLLIFASEKRRKGKGKWREKEQQHF